MDTTPNWVGHFVFVLFGTFGSHSTVVVRRQLLPRLDCPVRYCADHMAGAGTTYKANSATGNRSRIRNRSDRTSNAFRGHPRGRVVDPESFPCFRDRWDGSLFLWTSNSRISFHSVSSRFTDDSYTADHSEQSGVSIAIACDQGGSCGDLIIRHLIQS